MPALHSRYFLVAASTLCPIVRSLPSSYTIKIVQRALKFTPVIEASIFLTTLSTEEAVYSNEV
jgi:hypothetical protein